MPQPIPADPHRDLETALGAVEQRLQALGDALRERNVDAIDTQAGELHRALAQAVHRFAAAARAGGVPQPLRRRLASASGQVATQRELLARATAALDRAIEVLLPQATPAAVYGAARSSLGGTLQA
jgi:hypothetical protein